MFVAPIAFFRHNEIGLVGCRFFQDGWKFDGMAKLDHRPLFTQVRDLMFERIAGGQWAPGDPIPSEAQLAVEFGVSLATMRKALKELENEHLIVRTQGRGTFVAKFTEENILLRFFRLHGANGEAVRPASDILSSETVPCSADQARYLKVAAGAPVHRVHRLRRIQGTPVVFDEMVIPAERFPRIGALRSGGLADQVYVLLQRDYGVTVTRTAEEIRAIAAPVGIAAHLDLAAGDPVLLLYRTAFDMRGAPVEFRASYCRTDRYHYNADNV